MLFALLDRAFKLCSNFERFHQEIDKVKTVFENNSYPKSFVDFCIKKYVDKVFIKKQGGTENLEKKTYLRPSFPWKKFCKLKVILQSSCKLNPLFRYKDSLQKKIRSDIVYRYMCSNCKVTYYGKT